MENSAPSFTPLFFGPGGYLTADERVARRVQEAQGGRLFRLGRLFLVGEPSEAAQWGWRPEPNTRRAS